MASQGYKRTHFEDDEFPSNGDLSTPDISNGPTTVHFKGRGWWRTRPFVERLLVLLLALLLVVLLVMVLVVVVKDNQISDLKKQGNEFCLSQECVTVASSLLLSMDQSVDPCDDFYKYACGGWMKAHPIPSGHSRWGTFEVLWQKNMLVMKNAIDKADSTFNSSAELKAKKFYKSCMDPDKLIESAGGQPLVDLLSQIRWGGDLSKWGPGETLAADWSLQGLMEDCSDKDVYALFGIGIGEDDKNSSANILQVDQGGLGLPGRDYYLNKTISEDKQLTAYLNFMVKVFTLLGAPNQTYTTQVMTQVIEFETQLANITIPEEERRDEKKNYHKMNLGEMNKNFTAINWLSLANNLLSVADITVKETEPVVVYAPQYLTDLTSLLDQYLSTPEGKLIITKYYMWRMVQNFAAMLSKPFREAQKGFLEAMSGMTGSDETWHICISSTDGVLGFATGSMFIRSTFNGDSKIKAKEMIENVREAFKANLPKLKWMDPKTQAAAIDKANAVTDMIGYPEYIMDSTKLDKKYEMLTINESDYFGNNLRALHFATVTAVKKLRKVPENEWVMTPPTVNAYYTSSKNTIVFPAGLLQAPFFDRTFPQSLNYGAMGVVMGHELTHGFDDQGREFDKKGNLKDWWDPDAVKRFKEKTKCMIEQYSSYKINGEHERGKQTLGENIADNGGLKSAYHAYQEWVKRHEPEQRLPAIGLTHQQLFFLSFAQVWCWNSKPESDHLQIIKDPHAPAKSRVIGPLSNSREFAKVYNCPKNSRMNPVEKCEVW